MDKENRQNKLKLYASEGKTYITDGKNMWVYDGEEIKKSTFTPTVK